jgi:beta-lactamase superfamily II metal-dependent hydrolase
MAWNLEIHTIDVAQGESSLLVAYTDDGTQFKSMLIDGGLGKYGRLVHNYVSKRLGVGRNLDYMVTTHFDKDHSGGQITLFKADNITSITTVIGDAVGLAIDDQVKKGATAMQQAVAGFAAYVATVFGAYEDGQTDAREGVQAAITASLSFLAGLNSAPASNVEAMEAVFGEAVWATEIIQDKKRRLLNPALMKLISSQTIKSIGTTVINAAMQALGQTASSKVVADTLFRLLAPPLQQAGLIQTSGLNHGFQTNGIYRNTTVYNPGNVGEIGSGFPSKDLTDYFMSLEGKVEYKSFTGKVPSQANNLGRQQIIPDLGEELLKIKDNNAPKVYCVAILQRVLGSDKIVSADNGNGISIGLAIVFNQFVFYTGGDLPADGLNLIPKAVIKNKDVGNAATIASYKAGHHGSDNSNSSKFLADSSTRCAVISTGSMAFNNVILPPQVVVDWLVQAPMVIYFYFTNAKTLLTGVPGTDDKRQVVAGNKSRISGDNKFDPGEKLENGGASEAKINRGDIIIKISEAESKATTVPPAKPIGTHRQYKVTYFEEDDLPGGPKDVPTGFRTEVIYF